jgi:hypothetical protein
MECLTIFFSLLSMILSVMVLKMGMPDHIFLSPFHDTCSRVSRGKKEIKYDAGFYLL